jgi:MFS superfamily sulfate permease-like transporter
MAWLLRGARPIDRAGAVRNVLAGFTLAAMNVPQALGYARIAGMPVVTGLYTLLLPMLAFALLGSSRYLVVAADSATAAILAGGLAPLAPVASERWVALAGAVALLTAGYLLLARLFKLGFLADFLSQTVLVGFLTGVGVQVAIAVSGEMLGIPVRGSRSLDQLGQLLRQLDQLQLETLGLSAAVVAIVLGCRRFAPRVPGPLLAVVCALAASAAIDLPARGVRAIGPIDAGLPSLRLPSLAWSEWLALLPVAASCFLMIVAQSAATARAYATRHHQALDENADLAGLSAANAAAALSGSFVVNGSPTQTAMVERSGGTSQLAQIATVGLVALVLLALTGPLEQLPQCVLGAIVFTIAIGLIDARGLRSIRRESPGEYRLALAAAATVVLIGIEAGILFAMALSLLRHVNHSYRPHTAVLVKDSAGHWLSAPAAPGTLSGEGFLIYRFGAALFYANARHFAEETRALVAGANATLRWLVIDAGAITNVDYSAARALADLQQDLARDGVALVFVHVTEDLRADLDRHQLTQRIQPQRIFASLHEALAALART